MNGEILKVLFQKEFASAVEKHLAANNLLDKATLIIDSTPSHPPAMKLCEGKLLKRIPLHTKASLKLRKIKLSVPAS